jgi:hypothetical protein
MKKNVVNMQKSILASIVIFILLSGTNFSVSQTIDDVNFSIKCNTHCCNEKEHKRYESFQSMQCVALSKMNRFRVHYDTTGLDAVEKTDKDKNGIPDYIDSVCAVFDYVYEVEVIQMGMERPRTDLYDANNPYYDINVRELGIKEYPEDPVYGITREGLHYPNSLNKSYTSIEIDNNYSPNDTYKDEYGKVKKTYSTTDIAALKVTAAHEYHHAIQYAIGMVIGNNNSIYEMAAVCLEMLVYPDLYDYVNYVNALMTNIDKLNFGNGEASNGYCYGIFFYMLTEKYGRDIIRDYFILTNEVNSCYKGLDSILVLNNSSLHRTWMEFIEWLYHSGKNSIEGKYFPMASRFKTPVPKNIFKNYGLNTNDIKPYQLTYTMFINSSEELFIQPDTIDVIFTNAGTEEVIVSEKTYRFDSIQCNAISNETEITDGEKLFENFWLKIFSPSLNMDYYLVTKAGGRVRSVAHCYPTPFNKNINQYLCFPIADDIIVGEEKVKLTIYNCNQTSVFSGMLETSIDNYNRVLKYNPVELNSGIYTFTISRGSTDLVGKIVIK